MKKIQSVAVYCGASTPGKRIYTDAAAALGRYLAEHSITLVYGGSYCGTMRTIADAVLESGGSAVGVFSSDVKSEHVHPLLTDSIMTSSLAERKRIMLERSNAAIALPGSLGTFDELFDAAALIKLGRFRHPLGVMNINGYFDPLLEQIRKSTEEGFTSPQCAGLIVSASNPDDMFSLFERIAADRHCK